jgi:tetratricopeptide (TPR) repeat protein
MKTSSPAGPGMKPKKPSSESRKGSGAPVQTVPRASILPYVVAALAAIILVFWAYSPALNGPFLFDDTTLPFALPAFSPSLPVWLSVDVRPVLFFTYWVNYHIGQNDPYSFHVVNILIHLVSGWLIFVIVRRLLEWRRGTLLDGRGSVTTLASGDAVPIRAVPSRDREGAVQTTNDNLLAAFAAAIFLLHPVQTEAVAYLAGRSESLSAMFVLATLALFLYRRKAAVSWSVVAAVLALFGLALLSKQSAIVLPALLLLTDYWWNPPFSFQGIRANWKIYAPMALGALAGVAFFWRIIRSAETAGFGMKDLTWYQYFFTQCRALFVYLGMFLLPMNLTADWDFAISRTVLDRGAIVGMVVLLAMVAAAWHYRRRFPLAGYGFFVFLLMMAPTSSFLPIKDPIAERRLYSAILGLLLIVVDLVGRVKLERKVLVAACLVVVLLAAVVTHARAAVWSDPLALWEDTARKAPNKRRVRFQLGYAYFSMNPPQFERAIAEFEKAAQLEPPDANLMLDWGLALDGLNRRAEALAKLRTAAMMDRTAHVYSQIGMVYAKNGDWAEALDALAAAEKIDANFPPIYVYRGKIFLIQKRCADASREYQRALATLVVEPGYEQPVRELRQLLQTGCH